MTILDCCISLKRIKKMVVLGVVEMRQLLLKTLLIGSIPTLLMVLLSLPFNKLPYTAKRCFAN